LRAFKVFLVFSWGAKARRYSCELEFNLALAGVFQPALKFTPKKVASGHECAGRLDWRLGWLPDSRRDRSDEITHTFRAG
jgi:hypothetical protein